MAVENSSSEYILRVVASQREYFRSGATLDVKFRKEMLQCLLDSLHKWEKPLAEALSNDLHKSYEEAYMTELSIVTGEIRNHLRNISRWSKCKCCATPLKMFPSRRAIFATLKNDLPVLKEVSKQILLDLQSGLLDKYI